MFVVAIVINMKIGDKFRERMPKFVGNGKCYFSWIIEIVGFKKESYGNFAICKRTDDNKVEIVNYAVEVLNEDYGYESI